MAKKVVIGELDNWDDADVGQGIFKKIDEGDHVGRIFTKPYQHYLVFAKDKTGKTHCINSPVNGCPLVERGEKASPRWYVGFYDREMDKPTVITITPTVLRALKNLNANKHWGKLSGYDVVITRGPSGTNPLYSVQPIPHSPMKKEEVAKIKEFMEEVDFAELVKPMTPEQIREVMGMPSPKKKTVTNDFEEPETDSDDADVDPDTDTDADDEEVFDFGA